MTPGREEPEKSKADVRSPQTARRHALIFGSGISNRASRNCNTDVWSKTCEHTHPPLVQGEMISMGTRGPKPIGLPSSWIRAGNQRTPVAGVLIQIENLIAEALEKVL